MRIAFNACIMDLLHKGHLDLLRLMRANSDKVIIIIHDDKSCYLIKDKFPVQTLKHRIRNIRMTGLVDDVIVTKSTDPYKEFETVIKKYDKHDLVYYRGDDLVDSFPGKWLLDKFDIKIHYKPYTKGVSSTKIRDSL